MALTLRGIQSKECRHSNQSELHRTAVGGGSCCGSDCCRTGRGESAGLRHRGELTPMPDTQHLAFASFGG